MPLFLAMKELGSYVGYASAALIIRKLDLGNLLLLTFPLGLFRCSFRIGLLV
jgi:hypothetical protein